MQQKPFALTPHVHIERAQDGIIRHLRHVHQPYLFQGLSGPSLAARYVQDVAEHYRLPVAALSELRNPCRPSNCLTDKPACLWFHGENALADARTIMYRQTFGDLPIWQAGLSVTVHVGPDRVTSSFSTFRHDVRVEGPVGDFRPHGLAELESLIPLGQHGGKVEITSQRRLIYRYEAARRIDNVANGNPRLELPSVPQEIAEGGHYIVREVLFTTSPGYNSLNWHAFIEERTGSVLYLRALVDCMLGKVFNIDPISDSGNAALTACSGNAALDPLQIPVTLPVIGTNPQCLAS